MKKKDELIIKLETRIPDDFGYISANDYNFDIDLYPHHSNLAK